MKIKLHEKFTEDNKLHEEYWLELHEELFLLEFIDHKAGEIIVFN